MVDSQMLPSISAQVFEKIKQFPNWDKELLSALFLIPSRTNAVNRLSPPRKQSAAFNGILGAGMIDHLLKNPGADPYQRHFFIRAG